MGQLENLFRADPSRLALWREQGLARRLDLAEELLQRAQGLGVNNLEKLVNDAPNFEKFCDLLSEVRFAIEWASLGAVTTLLADDFMGNERGRKGADIHVQFDDGYQLLVEVRRGSDGDPRLHDFLERALRENNLPFRISYSLGMELGPTPGLSRPGTTGKERAGQESMRDEVIAAVISGLRDLPKTATGTLAVGPHSFDYDPSPTGFGYVGFYTTGVGFIRMKAHGSIFLRDIQHKSVNPETFIPPWSSIPYIVAYDAEQFPLSTLQVFGALVGERSFFNTDSDEERVAWIKHHLEAVPSKIKEKMADPAWSTLLDAWGFHARGTGVFDEYGCFVCEPWADNIDGVLVRRPTRSTCQWVPNPWGRNSTPRLLELGFLYHAPPEDELPF